MIDTAPSRLAEEPPPPSGDPDPSHDAVARRDGASAVARSFEECRLVRPLSDAHACGGEPINRATPRPRGVEPRGLLNATALRSGPACLAWQAAARFGAPAVGVVGVRGVGRPVLDPQGGRVGQKFVGDLKNSSTMSEAT